MQCPIDKCGMRTILIRECTIDACDTCGGVWFDDNELRNIAQMLMVALPGQIEEVSPLVKANKEKRFTPLTESTRTKKTIHCPIDGSETIEFVYAGDSDVSIDRCPSCRGIWFDGNELIHLSTYLKPSAKDLLGTLLIQQTTEANNATEELKHLPLLPLKIIGKFFYPAFLAYSVLLFLVDFIGLDLGAEIPEPIFGLHL